MMRSPAQGETCQVWYSNHRMPHHGRVGWIAVPGRGRPRNHLIGFPEGDCAVVPGGNVRRVPSDRKHEVTTGKKRKKSAR